MKFHLLIFAFSIGLLSAAPEVYRSISDITNPKRSDYLNIQKYLKKGDRKELNLLKEAITPGGALYDYNCRARRLLLVGEWPWQGPKFDIIPFQCSLKDKKICVLTYVSYNKNYRAGIDHIKKALKKIGFKGHFIYRIGGWPDLKGGSLKLAHVPYSFKPCFIKEVKEMGYELVLWLDASIRPIKSLDFVFKSIEEKGYFFYPSGHTLAQYCTKETMEALDEPVENATLIPSVAAGIFGVNLRHPQGLALMEKWYEAAQKEVPFWSPRPDQNSLSILIHQMHLNEWQSSGLSWENYNETTQFYIDWKSIQ